MPPMVTRFVASVLFALPLAVLACPSARGEPAPAGGAPNAVTEEVAAQPTPEAPVKVVVGAYINDIQELDFKTNSYAIDLYVWFRWKGAASATSSTTNRRPCPTAASIRSSAIRGSSRPNSSLRNIPSTRKPCWW